MSNPTTAFVLGGGGVLGAVEVGMLRALFRAEIQPDLVVGTSIGAVNGALVAADPSEAVTDRLLRLWSSPEAGEIFGDSLARQLRRFAARTHLHSPRPLRRLLERELGEGTTFADLKLPFRCCAANIERAAEQWFDSGPVVDAVLASAAVPGLLPPAQIDGLHYIDGGIVNSIPVDEAVRAGAERIYVLQVGRIERALTPPKRPWEVAQVAFEVARLLERDDFEAHETRAFEMGSESVPDGDHQILRRRDHAVRGLPFHRRPVPGRHVAARLQLRARVRHDRRH